MQKLLVWQKKYGQHFSKSYDAKHGTKAICHHFEKQLRIYQRCEKAVEKDFINDKGKVYNFN